MSLYNFTKIIYFSLTEPISTYITYAPELGAGDPLKTAILLLASPSTKLYSNSETETKKKLLNSLDKNISNYMSVVRASFLNHISKHWFPDNENIKITDICDATDGNSSSGFASINISDYSTPSYNWGKGPNVIVTQNGSMKPQGEIKNEIIEQDADWKKICKRVSDHKIGYFSTTAAEKALDLFLSKLTGQDLKFIAKNDQELQITFKIAADAGPGIKKLNLYDYFGRISKLVLIEKSGSCTLEDKTSEINAYLGGTTAVTCAQGHINFTPVEVRNTDNANVYFSLTLATKISATKNSKQISNIDNSMGSGYIQVAAQQ